MRTGFAKHLRAVARARPPNTGALAWDRPRGPRPNLAIRLQAVGHMEALPGLRPVKPAIEAAKPAVRDAAESSRESARFEEHLNQAHAQRQRAEGPSRADKGPSHADKSARHVRKEAQESEPAARSDTHKEADPQTKKVAGGEQVAETTSASAVESEASPPNTKPAARAAKPTEDAKPVQPEAVVEPVALPSLAVSEDSSSAAPAQAQHPETANAGAAAQPTAGVLAAAASVVKAPQVTVTLAPETSNTLQLLANEPQSIGEKPATDSLDVAQATTHTHSTDAAANVAADVLARALPASSAVSHDFARDLAQLAETAAPKAPHAGETHAASESAAEILRQVRVGLSADLREANIQLAPEALGRVSIRLRVENGTLTADVRAESAQALRALELHAPELKAALAQHGVPPSAMVFSFMNSHAGDPSGRGHASPFRSPRASFPSANFAPAALERALARRLSASGVDTYA